MLRRLFSLIFLPEEITAFERNYLLRINKISMIFFLAHIPVFMLIAWANQSDPMQALVLTSLVLMGPVLALKTLSNPRHVSLVFGITAMLVGGLLVHFGRGIWTIEMHFYFFASLALLTVYANPLVILVAALTVALHHLIFWFIQPVSVFNYEAPITSVLVHAAFVVLESVAACFVARSFFDNVIGLDRIVQRRTDELSVRNQEMRLVLDNVDQGLLTMNHDGKLSGEYSRFLAECLGTPGPGQFLWDYLAVHDACVATQFALGWDAVLDDVLPLEILLDQLPTLLQLPQRTLKFNYIPIAGATSAVDKLLIVISDVTAQLQHERAEAEKQEMMAVFEKAVNHRGAFIEFIHESESLVGSLVDTPTPPLPVVRRQVHTLKGNCSIYGLKGLSALCHDIETRMSESGQGLASSDRSLLKNHWQSLAEKTEKMLQWKGPRRIELDESEVEEFCQCVAGGLERPSILQKISSWSLQPTHLRLDHFAEQASDLARRLDKVPVRVQVESNRLRLDSNRWADFWVNFSHVVRNAVDHGLETPEERRRAGKSEPALLRLRTLLVDQSFVVEISDDGRGVDWAAVRKKALEMGLATDTPEQLSEALFADSLSTRLEVTEYSGRGVGLTAVREACRPLGGTVRLTSLEGQGTTLQFIFPLSSMGQRSTSGLVPALQGGKP
jgi:two-component system chemotaxis sensor kinase CheA